MTLKKKSILAGSLIFLLFTSACGKKVEVTIIDDDAETTLETNSNKTVEKILNEAEITLNEEDTVEPALDQKIEETPEITITRMHHVKITVDGEVTETSMLGGTVKELLEREGITLAENMTMNVKEDDRLKDNMEIIIESFYGVTIVHDGKEENVQAGAGTVEEFLKASSISLGADDIVALVDGEVEGSVKVAVDPGTTFFCVETELIGAWHEPHDDSDGAYNEGGRNKDVAPIEVALDVETTHYVALFGAKIR